MYCVFGKVSDTVAVSVTDDCHVVQTAIKSLGPVVVKFCWHCNIPPVTVPEQVHLKLLRCCMMVAKAGEAKRSRAQSADFIIYSSRF